ncbi:MAG: DUF115 domain-containing protein [Spirochaetaceae bacterium]|nr:DUF115 domain-containing protein [Spirochaetaceae bacterium]
MENNKETNPELVKVSSSAPTKVGDQYTVLYKNTFIYDKNAPIAKIEQKIDNIEIKNNTLVLIPSPVLFYGLKALYKNLPENCSILCIEYEKELYELKERPESDYLPEIEYINITNYDIFLNFFDTKKDLAFIKHILFLPLNKGYLLHKDFYTECYDNLKRNLKQFLKNTLTLYSLGNRYYKNLILNLPFWSNGKDIKELKIDKPVVITGAGESIEKALPLLKKNRNLLKIIAIDTSLKTLVNFGIIPDFIIAVESQLYNIFDFLGNSDTTISIIADMTTYPLTSRIFTGDKYYFTSSFTSSNFLDILHTNKLLPTFIPPLGSVGITALYIASMISSSYIFYTGLDFSFMIGKTHAKDTPMITNTLVNWTRLSEKNNYYISSNDNFIEAGKYSNKTIYTTPVLKSYAEIMDNIISKNKNIYSLFSSPVLVKNKNSILDEETFISMITSSDLRTLQSSTILHSNNPEALSNIDIANRSKKIKIFLEKELDKIDKIIISGVDFLNGISQESNQQIIKQLVEKSDYLLPYYPSANYSKTLDSVAVKYILLACYSFSKAIKNTLLFISP